jgi:hypothetical protein
VTTPPKAEVTVADMAWMAAVLDLKGAVVQKNNKTRKTPQLVLRADTRDPRIARKLAALTGVAPEPHERQENPFSRRGCAEHCLEPHVHVDPDHPWQMPQVTRWAVTGGAAAVILLNLRPYLTTYGDYIGSVALILKNLVTEGQGSGMVRSSLARLEQLGWKIPRQIENKMKERG